MTQTDIAWRCREYSCSISGKVCCPRFHSLHRPPVKRVPACLGTTYAASAALKILLISASSGILPVCNFEKATSSLTLTSNAPVATRLCAHELAMKIAPKQTKRFGATICVYIGGCGTPSTENSLSPNGMRINAKRWAEPASQAMHWCSIGAG